MPKRCRGRSLPAATWAVLLALVCSVRGEPICIGANMETDAVIHGGDAADDAAIWLHPGKPELSLIIGSEKASGGGLYLFNLDGSTHATHLDGAINNVDVTYNFPLGGEYVDLVAGSRCEGANQSIAVYRVDPVSRTLADVAAGNIAVQDVVSAYGFCLYRSPVTDKYYAFVNDTLGNVEQWELFDNGSNCVDAVHVRSFSVGSACEGMVADYGSGYVYVAEEEVALWRYGAEPGDGTNRTLVDVVGDGPLVPDLEGLSILYTTNGSGYLLASSQGDEVGSDPYKDTFAVYERAGSNAYIKSFQIIATGAVDEVTAADGIDAVATALGADFPYGIFVAHDGYNPGDNQNLKVVSWEVIAEAGASNLLVEPAWDPRSFSYPTNAYMIAAMAGPNGEIMPEGVVWVSAGSNATFSFTPDPLYSVYDILIEGQSAGAASDFTFTNVSGNATIEVLFQFDGVMLMVVGDRGQGYPAGGTHVYAGGTEVSCGITNAILTVGTTQHVCSGWIGTGSAPENGTSTNTGPFNITSDSYVTWTWNTQYYLDVVVAGGSGTVNVTNGWRAAGSDVSITVTPASNRYFAGWQGNTGGCTIAGNQIDVPMSMARQITADVRLMPESFDHANFEYRMKVEFPGYEGTVALTNFPVLVIMNTRRDCTIAGTGVATNLDYGQFCSVDGHDLRFTDSGMNLIPYEVENWDTNGDSHVWVRVPMLSGTNTSVWAWWGNQYYADLPEYATNGATWANGYLGVWHLKETQSGVGNPDVYFDSSVRGNSGHDYIGASGREGVVFNGHEFDGTNDYIQLEKLPIPPGNPLLGASNFTLSVWLKRMGNGITADTGTGGVFAEPVLTKGKGEVDGDERDMNYFFGIRPADAVLVADFEEGASGRRPGLNHPVIGVTPVVTGVWTHAAVTYDGVFVVYLNGVSDQQVSVGEPPCAVSIQPAALGSGLISSGAPTGAFNGYLDEARISMIARSGDWLRASYLTVASNDLFAVYEHAPLPGRILAVESICDVTEPLPGVYASEYGTVYNCRITDSTVLNNTTQYVYAGWSGTGSVPLGGTDTNTGPFVLRDDSSLVWIWDTNFHMDFNSQGSGTVDRTDGWWPAGSNVLVTASPFQYTHFDSWSGDTGGCAIVTNTINVLIDAPRCINAVFAENVGAMGTPEWWLAQHGITGAVPDVAELGDADLDRMLNWEEWIAGTDPTNNMSLLSVTNIWECGADEVFLVWQSVTGRTYAVQSCRSLVGGAWTNVSGPGWTNVEGDGNPITYTDVSSGCRFFRLRVWQP